MLIILSRWRAMQVTRLIEKIMKTHKQRKLFHGGIQALINLAVEGYCGNIDTLWNVSGLGRNPNIEHDLLERAYILHWSGKDKPWLEDGSYKYLWDPYNVTI